MVFKMSVLRFQLNAVAWDVAEMELSACETLSRNMLEPIDYKMVAASGKFAQITILALLTSLK